MRRAHADLAGPKRRKGLSADFGLARADIPERLRLFRASSHHLAPIGLPNRARYTRCGPEKHPDPQ